MKNKITKTEEILKRNVKELRESQSKTRYAVAKGTDMDCSNYNRLEDPNFHKEPLYTTLERIAAYYNIEVYELFKP